MDSVRCMPMVTTDLIAIRWPTGLLPLYCLFLLCRYCIALCTVCLFLKPVFSFDDGACSFGHSRDEHCHTHRPSLATKPTPTEPVTPEPLSKPSPEPSPTRKLVCCRALPQLLEPRSHVTGVPVLRDDTPVVNVSLSHAGSAPPTCSLPTPRSIFPEMCGYIER